jgi:hypothetical protein
MKALRWTARALGWAIAWPAIFAIYCLYSLSGVLMGDEDLLQ